MADCLCKSEPPVRSSAGLDGVKQQQKRLLKISNEIWSVLKNNDANGYETLTAFSICIKQLGDNCGDRKKAVAWFKTLLDQ